MYYSVLIFRLLIISFLLGWGGNESLQWGENTVMFQDGFMLIKLLLVMGRYRLYFIQILYCLLLLCFAYICLLVTVLVVLRFLFMFTVKNIQKIKNTKYKTPKYKIP